MTLYVRREKVRDESAPIMVECDVPDVVLIKGSPFRLHPHSARPDQLVGSFSVTGSAIHPAVLITAGGDGVPDAEAMLQVVSAEASDRIFSGNVEFERPEYSVIQGRAKSLRLFAKFPEIVRTETEVVVSSSDTNRVATIGRCKFVPKVGTNFAEGSIKIRGGRLHSRATIRVTVNGHSAEAKVTVIDKPQHGIPIEVEIKDEDFGNFRAIWADREGKPNLLLISAKDEYLARCLGKPPNFPGQHHPVSRALIAEIFAESVCRKLLSLEAKMRPFDFPWREMAGPHLIVDDVFANFHQRFCKISRQAHETMLGDEDFDQIAHGEAAA